MAEVPLHRQFAGQARLVRLLLWRIGDSTDIDECLAAARSAGMIGADDEAFLRKALSMEEGQREGSSVGQVAELPVDKDTIVRLRRCVDKLNQADSA